MRQRDTLAIQVQSAFYGAYWNGFSKHKKSLDRVLKDIYKGTEKKKKVVPIDFKRLENEFIAMEELHKNGWTKK